MPFAPPAGGKPLQQVALSGGWFSPARPDEFEDDAFKCCSALRRGPAALAEVDPSLVEAVEHPDPRQWISRSLRAENLLPAFPRHRLDPDGAFQHRGEGA